MILNLFLLKIETIKKAIQKWFPSNWQRLFSQNRFLKHLISFAFLIIQQRKPATKFHWKLSNSKNSVNLSLFQFFLCWIHLSKWVFDGKKSGTNLISRLLTKNWFQRTVLQDTDFIRFFGESKQRKLTDSFSVQTWRLMFLKRFNYNVSLSLPIRNQQRSFIEIFSAKPFKIDRNLEQTF